MESTTIPLEMHPGYSITVNEPFVVMGNDWWTLSQERKEFLCFLKYGYYMDDISTLNFDAYEKISDHVFIHRNGVQMIYKLTPSTCEYLGVQK